MQGAMLPYPPRSCPNRKAPGEAQAELGSLSVHHLGIKIRRNGICPGEWMLAGGVAPNGRGIVSTSHTLAVLHTEGGVAPNKRHSQHKPFFSSLHICRGSLEDLPEGVTPRPP